MIDNDFPMWKEREDEEIWLTSHDNGDRSIGEKEHNRLDFSSTWTYVVL